MTSKKKKISNINDLVENLSSTYSALEANEMPIDKGTALARTASAIVSGLRVKLDYNHKRAINKPIPFLETK
jgi:hypothetical protein